MSQWSPSHIRATAVRMATLRRLALSVLFTRTTTTIATNSYQTTCTVSERTFNKRQHANARYRVTRHSLRITTTRMRSSRMCTVRCIGHLWGVGGGVCLPGGVFPRGCLPAGGRVSACYGNDMLKPHFKRIVIYSWKTLNQKFRISPNFLRFPQGEDIVRQGR